MLNWLKNNLLSVCLCATLVALFFDYGIVLKVLYIITIALFAVDFLYMRRWRGWHWTKDKYLYVTWIVFFLLHVLYMPFEQSHWRWEMRTLENYLPFLAMGCIGLMGLQQVRLRTLGHTLILAAIIIPLYVLLFGKGLGDFNTARKALVGQHIAFDIMLATAMAFAIWLYGQAKQWKHKIGYIISILYIFAFLFISKGRMGFLMGNLLLVIFVIMLLYQWLSKKSKVLKYSVLSILLVVAIGGVAGLLLSHSRMQNMGKDDPRVGIWQTYWAVAKERPVLGYGLSDGRQRFTELGQENTDLYNWHKGYYPRYVPPTPDNFLPAHAHNQFLQSLIDLGVLGVLLVLFFFIYPLCIVPRKTRLLLWCVMIIYGISVMFDIFGAFVSPFAFCLWCILCLSVKTNATNP